MNSRRSALGPNWSWLLLFGSSCVCVAEVKADVDFGDVSFPLSWSEALLDERGTTVPAEQLTVVGQLNAEDTGWGLAWGWIQLDDVDVAHAIDAQIRAADGEGVIGVGIDAWTSSGWSQWNIVGCLVPVVGWLPIYPTPIYVRITGRIVRRKAPTASS
jgi:hypothetical protein